MKSLAKLVLLIC